MLKKIILLLFMVSQIYAMSQKDLAIAIDHSVRQSVRTQKMVKEALLIKMGIDVEENVKRMKFTTSMLNKDLDAFLGRRKSKIPTITDKDILPKIEEFQKMWKEVEKRASAVYNLKYSDEDIKYLADNNIKFLLKSRAVVLAIVKKYKDNSNLKLANDIKIAGKQRMLVQMISKDIVMYLNNYHKKESLKDLNKIKAVNKNFNALFNGDKDLKCVGVKIPKIVNKLKEAQKGWIEAKPLIAKALKKKDKKIVKEIIAKLDVVRVKMREAVILYTKSLNREKQFVALNGIIDNFYNKSSKTKQIIDLAGKQRMITQRLAKLAIECSYNLTKTSCNDLEKDRKHFDNVLKIFTLAEKKHTLEPKLFNLVKDDIKNVKDKWSIFNKNIKLLSKSNGKDKNALNKILQNNIELLKLSNTLVSQMLKYYKGKLTELEQKMLRVINVAGKNRMLSQKMTKEYLEKNILKLQSANSRLQDSTKLFSLILTTLQNGNNKLKIPKVTNYKIKKSLKKIENLWSKIEPIYLKNSPTKKEIKLIVIANNILLKEMDKTVKLITKTTEY